jgi:hypothetical protein
MVYEYEKNADGDYVCLHCSAVKKKQSTMHMHYKANHDGSLKHKCKDCNYETATKQSLDKHIQARHPEKAEKKANVFECPCSGCDYDSKNKAGLRSHYMIRHLSNEIDTYLGKNDDGDISCTACGVEFASKPAFIYHLVNCLPEDVLSRKEVRDGLGLAA